MVCFNLKFIFVLAFILLLFNLNIYQLTKVDENPDQIQSKLNFLKQVATWFLDHILDIYGSLSSLIGQNCDSWYDKDTGPPNDLPPCPPTAEQARADQSFLIDPSCLNAPCLFHPGADFCIRSKLSSPSGAGQQCCYTGDQLLIGPPGGGTPDKCHSSRVFCHFYEDVLPWVLCCKNNDLVNCIKYYDKRPSDDGHLYNKSIEIK